MFTTKKAKETLESLSYIFDVARIVDPINNKVIKLGDSSSFEFEPYNCYQVWNKHERCTNCISYQSQIKNKRITKYEFVNNDIYYVVSKPISLLINDDNTINCCIEIVSKVTDEIIFGKHGEDKIIDQIIASEKKVYTDSLTSVYNRKYFDDRMFCIDKGFNHTNKTIFLMVDIKNFKSINDNYGHVTGDLVLQKTASIIKSNILPNDFVIRFGGDEFLIIINNNSLTYVNTLIKNLKTKISEIKYDPLSQKHVKANIGYSYRDKFINNPDFISDLLDEADKNMYLDKKKI